MPCLQVDDETLKRLKELHRKRSLGVATGWEELDTVLAGLLGPLNRSRRCTRCKAEGCVLCNWTGYYTCERCLGTGKLTLGQKLPMACPVCQEGKQ